MEGTLEIIPAESAAGPRVLSDSREGRYDRHTSPLLHVRLYWRQARLGYLWLCGMFTLLVFQF